MKEETSVDYDILYDEDLVVSRNMGLIHKNAVPVFSGRAAKRMHLDDVPITNKRADLPQPATFLFDADGKLLWSYVSTNYRIRPDTKDLLVAAEKHFGS